MTSDENKMPSLDVSANPWMTASSVCAVISAIRSAGGEMRFVGGAVRNALQGEAVDDVDLATDLTPDKVEAALRAAGLKAVPTGIAHGTITAVAKGKGYEITTLRRDVATDGRRARVEFTDDWQADAARRDFTFNAIYADADGRLRDYFGGIEDLRAGRVRFIGDAEERIREDVLRILRFFRFVAAISSRDGKCRPDEDALKACAALAPLMARLSAERIWKELKKLLCSSAPLLAVALMERHGIFQPILPEFSGSETLADLMETEKRLGGLSWPSKETPWPRRLAAIAGGNGFGAAAGEIARRLRFSKAEATRLESLSFAISALAKAQADVGRPDTIAIRRALYDFGPEAVADAALLSPNYAGNLGDLSAVLDAAKKWQRPLFPLRGEDLLDLGIPSGSAMGEMLKAVENWWISQPELPTKAQCLEELRRNRQCC